MAKKKEATNQPIVSEEPIREDEQFRLDESEVAPPSSRPVGPRTRVAGSGLKNYGARTARERRVSSPRRSATRAPRHHRSDGDLRPEIVAEMLEHPTIVVTQDQLRQEYSYVAADLRSMALTSVALIAALIILAQVLPK